MALRRHRPGQASPAGAAERVPARSRTQSADKREDGDTEWRERVGDLVLHSGAAIVTADPEPGGAAWVSIAIAGKALITNDLLLGRTERLALNEISRGHGGRDYALSVRPVQFGILSSAPVVDIHGGGFVTPIRVQLTLQLQLHHRVTQATAMVRTDFDEISFDEQTTMASFEFPLHTMTIDWVTSPSRWPQR